jgi:hypothetical protein
MASIQLPQKQERTSPFIKTLASSSLKQGEGESRVVRELNETKIQQCLHHPVQAIFSQGRHPAEEQVFGLQ